MTLLPCRECRREISDQASVCPHCGAPSPTHTEWKGTGFEWKSSRTFYGYPLVHIAFGRDARGRRRVARGIVAIGQFAVGLITVAQFGVGILFGFGQFICGLTAVSQFAVALVFGIGQFATGYIAIGQIVLGYYGLCQLGIARYIWSTAKSDARAVDFFHNLARQTGLLRDMTYGG